LRRATGSTAPTRQYTAVLTSPFYAHKKKSAEPRAFFEAMLA
jgi:hypothetical protein